MVDHGTISTALIVSGLGALTWFAFMVRVVYALARRQERRAQILVMPIVGVLAAVGLFAGAASLASIVGYWQIVISSNDLTVIANMGRGGLLMGGIIAAVYYRPESKAKEEEDGE